MKVVLANGKEFELLYQPISRSKFIQNATRDTIEFCFDRGLYNTDEIYNALSNEDNTNIIKLVDSAENDMEYIHNNYCIVDTACIKDEVVKAETAENAESTRKVISITLAQLTYTELQQREIQSKINELTEQNLMLMEAMTEVYESKL